MTIDDVITALEKENTELTNRIFDLEAEKEALISGQETLQKALVEKNAEIERLESLRASKDVIINNQEAEIEQWKAEANCYQNLWCEGMTDLQTAKSEAYKEFAEEFEKRCIASGIYPAVTKNILKNLSIELTEGKENG